MISARRGHTAHEKEVTILKEFMAPTRIISGTGAVRALLDLGSKRLMVVSDPFFAENGTAQALAQLSGASETMIYRDVKPDPTVEQAALGADALRRFQPDTLVALGGGSAMDLAKAMAYFGGEKVCLVAIPTTSGSGSEVTNFAVLTHQGTKYPLVDAALCPDVAILDDELLRKMPPSLVADAGFDVLAHAMEAMVAGRAGAVTDVLAKAAFATVLDQLEESYRGNLSVRLPIHQASTMAAMAFTRAGLGLCHALSHSLGGQFHVPHGRLNAILLPVVMECNLPVAQKKYAALARAAGLGGSADTVAVRNLKNSLLRLRKNIQLPATLAQAGIQPAALLAAREKIVAATLADECCKDNPVPVDAGMVRNVLQAVMGGG